MLGAVGQAVGVGGILADFPMFEDRRKLAAKLSIQDNVDFLSFCCCSE